MSEYSQALWDATSQLYEVFTPYREQALDGGWHIHLPNFELLTSTPLIELSVSDLTPLIQNLSAHEDGEQVLHRFLPRIMELCIDGYDRWSISLDAVFGSLSICEWHMVRIRAT